MQNALPFSRSFASFLMGALAAASTYAQSASPTVDGFPVWATQNTSMTGFKMTLTDLAPADGKAPSIAFLGSPGASASWGMGYALQGGSQGLTSKGFQLPDTHMSSGNGVADISIVQGDVFLKTQTRLGLEETPNGDRHLPSDGALAVVSEVQNFTLGAHTALTVSGTFSADMVLNLPAFRAFKDKQIFMAVNNFSPIGSLEMGFKNGDAMVDPVQAWLKTITSVNQPDMIKLLDSDVDKGIDWRKPQHAELPFTVTLSNDSDQAREARFRLYISAKSFHEFGWTASAVPEPSTYAMLMTGLAATGMATRLAARCKPGSCQAQRPL